MVPMINHFQASMNRKLIPPSSKESAPYHILNTLDQEVILYALVFSELSINPYEVKTLRKFLVCIVLCDLLYELSFGLFNLDTQFKRG
jgi:hypothetical protein